MSHRDANGGAVHGIISGHWNKNAVTLIWVADKRSDGLTSHERDVLRRLRRENKQLGIEREILSQAAAWFARETNAVPKKGSGS